MAAATYTLLVDWDDDDAFTGTGEDVTARLLGLGWATGRDFASQLTGRSSGAKLTALLDNSTGDYSSGNSGSPLAGNLLPGRKVRLNIGSGRFPYTFPIVWNDAAQWVGFVDGIEPVSRSQGKNTVVLTAHGALAYLNQEDIDIAMATSKATGAAFGDVLDALGWPAGDRDIDAGQTTMTRFWLDQQKALAALRVIERTESGFIREKPNGDIRFEDRHARLKSPHTVSQATFSDAVGATLGYSDPVQLEPLSSIFNKFPIDIQTYSVGALAVLWSHPETGASSPTLAPGESKTFSARYPTAAAASDAVAVDAWTTDFTANSDSGGGGADLTSDVSVAVTKTAQTMGITLTNNGSTLAYITLLQARGTPVTKDDVVRILAEDSSSQTKYGQRTFSPRQQFVPDTGEGQEWADFNLSIYKDPIPIIKITVSANRDHAHLVQVLTRQVSDRITLVANGGAGLGIHEDFFIESEDHKIELDGTHRVTWKLSPAGGFSNFWALGASKLDTETVMAY